MKLVFVTAISLLLLSTTAWAKQVAVIANPKSSIKDLNSNQVKDLYLGNIDVLPGGDKVQLVDQPRSATIAQEFYNAIASMTVKEITVYWAKKVFSGRGNPPPLLEGGDTKIRNWVASNPDGIGYIYNSAVDSSVKVIFVFDH